MKSAVKMEPAKSFVANHPLCRLGYYLRHPETWPEGFAFDFRREEYCAIGLAHRLGMIGAPIGSTAMLAFGLSSDEADSLFYEFPGDEVVPPDAIADRIDAYLEGESR